MSVSVSFEEIGDNASQQHHDVSPERLCRYLQRQRAAGQREHRQLLESVTEQPAVDSETGMPRLVGCDDSLRELSCEASCASAEV